jgi:Flp pilus assembly protein TadD
MRSGPIALVGFIALIAVGCATASREGESALRQGRYAEAATRFEQVVSENPTRVEGLVGLGIARYKLREFKEAEVPLTAAVAQQPDLPPARLYLGLTALQTGQDSVAVEQLSALRRLVPDPRVDAHIERTLRALRGGPLTAELRDYMAASLEDEVALATDLAATRQAMHDLELRRFSEERYITNVPRRCRCSE